MKSNLYKNYDEEKNQKETIKQRMNKFRSFMGIREKEIKPRKTITRESNSIRYLNKRSAFLEMYGGKCVCCGESIAEFLTIEHKLGQKGKKRESAYKAYSNATEDYNPDIYEILCYNCNCAKGKLGYCPHTKSLINY